MVSEALKFIFIFDFDRRDSREMARSDGEGFQMDLSQFYGPTLTHQFLMVN